MTVRPCLYISRPSKPSSDQDETLACLFSSALSRNPVESLAGTGLSWFGSITESWIALLWLALMTGVAVVLAH